MEHYDKLYDRITTKNERPLEANSRTFHRVTTTDDPIIRKLTSKGNVFATDAIISTLMCSTRSVHSWDIIVQRVGKKIFFDKRDNSDFGMWSKLVLSFFSFWKIWRMDQVKFVGDSRERLWSDMVSFNKPYQFNVFKGCVPQILLSLFVISSIVLRRKYSAFL